MHLTNFHSYEIFIDRFHYKHNPPLIYNILTKISKIKAKGKLIKVEWIKAHYGFDLNECTYQWTKSTYTRKQILKEETTDPVSHWYFQSAIGPAK